MMAHCKDCGLPYDDFRIDTVLRDNQWLELHPESEGGRAGILCANCIVRRAARNPAAIAAVMVIDYAPATARADDADGQEDGSA